MFWRLRIRSHDKKNQYTCIQLRKYVKYLKYRAVYTFLEVKDGGT